MPAPVRLRVMAGAKKSTVSVHQVLAVHAPGGDLAESARVWTIWPDGWLPMDLTAFLFAPAGAGVKAFAVLSYR
ncbi:hypothetical protein AB0C28_45395 [Nonomuraea sp. NPDC048892]|uniref:hypothetical protein n=1 Tax=Nonomuraea sp. NPDC048892 TaxID=3154624 RepID=UPI0033FD58A4